MSKERLWIFAILVAVLFCFGLLGIPVGLGAFLFFNAVMFSLWMVSRHARQESKLEKSEAANRIVNLFTVIFVVLTVPYLYRMDQFVTISLYLFHLGFLFLYMIFGSFPALLKIIDPVRAALYWLVFCVQWVIKSFQSVGILLKLQSVVIKSVLKVVLYGIISLVVFVVFATLLSQADPIFKEKITQILNALNIVEVIVRAIATLFVFFILAGLFTLLSDFPITKWLGTTEERLKVRFEKTDKFNYMRAFDAVLPMLVLLPVLATFALFVYVQFKYLFGVNISEVLKTFTFSEYARRGFGELIITIILTYPLLGWTINRSQTKSLPVRIGNYIISTLVLGCVYVMLYSAVTRMNIYADIYGPSLRRNYVYAGVVVFGIGFAAYQVFATIRTWKPDFTLLRSRFFGDFVTLAFLTMSLLLGVIAYVPWNNITVSQIQANYEKTGNLDVYQLTDMPREAVPQIYEFSQKIKGTVAAKNADGSCKTDCVETGVAVLENYTAIKKADYQALISRSIFNRVFGLNVSGIMLQISNIPTSSDAGKSISQQMNAVADRYAAQIAANNFDGARALMDPKMVATNIQGFSTDLVVKAFDPQSSLDYRQSEHDVLGNLVVDTQKYRSFSYQFTVERSPFVRLPSKKSSTTEDVVTITVEVGLRNGKAYVVGSNLALGYFEDSIYTTKSSSDSEPVAINEYGYHQYCDKPNFENWTTTFSGGSIRLKCSDQYTSQIVAPSSFELTDFLKR